MKFVAVIFALTFLSSGAFAKNDCTLFLEVKTGEPAYLSREAKRSIDTLTKKGYKVIRKFDKNEIMASGKFEGALFGTLILHNMPFSYHCSSSLTLLKNVDGFLIEEAFEASDNRGSEFGFFGGPTCYKTLQKPIKKIAKCL